MTVIKVLPVLAVCFFLGACATGNQETKSQDVSKPEPVKIKIDLTDEQMESAKEAVRAGLKDPESAQFTDLFGVSNDSLKSGFSVCGFVNAKNSYGGYIGKKPFAYSNGRAILLSTGSFADFDRKLIIDLCTSNAEPKGN